MANKNRPMQSSFSEMEYAAKKKVTRRDRFLGVFVRIEEYPEVKVSAR